MAKTLDLSGYKRVFAEEFNSFHVYNGKSGWNTDFLWGARTLEANRELQFYMDSSYSGTSSKSLGVNPFSVKNSVLTITANDMSSSVSKYIDGYKYTSGLITTESTFSQTYGYFEIRAQLPEGQGLWPAFWLLPKSGHWPPEIDVMETHGQNPDQVYQSTHGVNTHQSQENVVFANNASGSFHTYGVKWTASTIEWYLDGAATHSQSNFINEPMYMLANLAVGGSWPGNPDDTASFPAEMKIDYIRAYAQTSSNAGTLGSSEHAGDTGQTEITVRAASDSWKGDAKFQLLVDDVKVGSEATVTVQEGKGWQEFTFHANMKDEDSPIAIRFLNDAYGANDSEDRNLHVDGIYVNGVWHDASEATYSHGNAPEVHGQGFMAWDGMLIF
jgi:beta-glucanase (GH16 family)